MARVARLHDVERVVRFFEDTKGWTDGWTVHYWQGLSRSPAVVLGLLYLIRRDEEAAATELRGIRPDAPLEIRIIVAGAAQVAHGAGDGIDH